MSSFSQSSNQDKPWNGSAVPYQPQHQEWPYVRADFKRMDESPDNSFYSDSRFVTHIDDAAIASLSRYYDNILPRKGRILDLCSSWISHYPQAVESAAEKGDLQVVGLGMNQAELNKNKVLSKRILQDLNEDPNIPLTVCDEHAVSGLQSLDNTNSENGLLDCTTCVVSLDYLTRPKEVLESVKQLTKPGGSCQIIVSSRMFPTKATSAWIKRTPEQRLQMVGDYLHFAGWKDIEIVDIKAGDAANAPAEDQGGLHGFMQMMGMSGSDPLWCVRAFKRD
ncbi:hypothetical protein E4T38_05463 [Aureobasidium subglaciale]|nr:hypothetical protein E4T38_05463 [Aureobasidium subglaciale]KAI5221560.1 hypothetical protein E4T40_05403 [Aureobasidium subglaciale]KAI5225537.1 hypothetical protein E4T41_05215 [Aureobasidium subglaciale]KAI5261482.1 hypothetical protein E4T46_05114 [Aureobasidium subglaciale]